MHACGRMHMLHNSSDIQPKVLRFLSLGSYRESELKNFAISKLSRKLESFIHAMSWNLLLAYSLTPFNFFFTLSKPNAHSLFLTYFASVQVEILAFNPSQAHAIFALPSPSATIRRTFYTFSRTHISCSHTKSCVWSISPHERSLMKFDSNYVCVKSRHETKPLAIIVFPAC